MNKARKIRLSALALLTLGGNTLAHAYIVNIAAANPQAVYLRVGDGSITGGNYNAGGTPALNATVNDVTVTVPANVVGNGVAQVMATTARLTSDLDGFVFCNAGEVYVGGFYRRPDNTNSNGTLTVVAPMTLSNGAQTIPMSQISWTSRGNGDTGAQPILAGSFTGGSQVLASNFQHNTWRESCLAFRYANQNLVASGTYQARVTYTLTAP